MGLKSSSLSDANPRLEIASVHRAGWRWDTTGAAYALRHCAAGAVVEVRRAALMPRVAARRIGADIGGVSSL